MKSLLDRFRRWFSEKHEINYLYFSIFFIILATFSLSHFIFLEHPMSGIRLFFIIYALFQAFLEVATFLLIAYVVKRWAPRWVFFLFVAFSFLLLLYHFTDFTLLRTMDAPVSYLFKFLFGRGFDHLVTAFLALNMNFGMIVILFLGPLCIPFIGLLLYWGTNRIAQLNPWSLSTNQIILAIIVTSSSLLLLELLAHPYLDRWIYNKHHKNLPFGATFLQPTPQCISLPMPIKKPRDEKETKKKIPRFSQKTTLPNIYFFVIETLRRDFINEETAPHLVQFAKENLDYPNSYANSNWTPLSWFAIFHSDFPFHWAAMRDTWVDGSIPLQMLKQLGYKIWVYSSADLRYFNMDRAIFGEKRNLANRIEEHFFNRNLEPCDRDAACLTSFERDVKTHESQGNLYLFFFDGTHSEYSFPKDLPLKFQPSAKQIDYVTLNQKEIESVKNRYRNSIVYMDSLMGKFFDFMKKEGLYESGLIVTTGDHGEEFYEEGAFFHGTHLNRYQTEVPIFMRLPGKKETVENATHIDLFPTILHHITGVDEFNDLFDGKSLFTLNRWPYRLAVLQNGPDTPIEFSIEKGDEKVQFRFLSPSNIYSQLKLEIISLKTKEAGPIDMIMQRSFPDALTPLIGKKL